MQFIKDQDRLFKEEHAKRPGSASVRIHRFYLCLLILVLISLNVGVSQGIFDDGEGSKLQQEEIERLKVCLPYILRQNVLKVHLTSSMTD